MEKAPQLLAYFPSDLLTLSSLIAIYWCSDSYSFPLNMTINLEKVSSTLILQSKVISLSSLGVNFYIHIWKLENQMKDLPKQSSLSFTLNTSDYLYNFNEFIPISFEESLDLVILEKSQKRFLFQFSFGYFAKPHDFSPAKITIPIGTIISSKHKNDYKVSCQNYSYLLQEMDKQFNQNFKHNFEQYNQLQDSQIRSSLEIIQARNELETPVMNIICSQNDKDNQKSVDNFNSQALNFSIQKNDNNINNNSTSYSNNNNNNLNYQENLDINSKLNTCQNNISQNQVDHEKINERNDNTQENNINENEKSKSENNLDFFEVRSIHSVEANNRKTYEPISSQLKETFQPKQRPNTEVNPLLLTEPNEDDEIIGMMGPIDPNWKHPNDNVIKTFIKELSEFFPISDDQKLFCGVPESDPMFIFHVFHFLVIFEQITGISYDVRIEMKEGNWIIQDRCSGIEKDISSLTDIINQCLNKIIIVMKLNLQQRTIIQKIFLIENLYENV